MWKNKILLEWFQISHARAYHRGAREKEWQKLNWNYTQLLQKLHRQSQWITYLKAYFWLFILAWKRWDHTQSSCWNLYTLTHADADNVYTNKLRARTCTRVWNWKIFYLVKIKCCAGCFKRTPFYRLVCEHDQSVCIWVHVYLYFIYRVNWNQYTYNQQSGRVCVCVFVCQGTTQLVDNRSTHN